MHPRLVPFFNGVRDQINAFHTASTGMSNETKGGFRESGLRRPLTLSIPPVARIQRGDVIDAQGNITGQLDAVLVHHAAPALAMLEPDDCIVLAEGALGVLEVKSNLNDQWSEVERTWDKLKVIRRKVGGVMYGHIPASDAIPFYVLGYKGWKKPETLQKHAQALYESFGRHPAPTVYVISIDPPAYGVATCDDRGNAVVAGQAFSHEDRGHVIALLWADISARAQVIAMPEISWPAYLVDAASSAAVDAETRARRNELLDATSKDIRELQLAFDRNVGDGGRDGD